MIKQLSKHEIFFYETGGSMPPTSGYILKKGEKDCKWFKKNKKRKESKITALDAAIN
jgi:hypothetical protein